MDFFEIKSRLAKNEITEIYPDFQVKRTRDLMIQGKQFYAIWDEEAGLWSQDEFDVIRLVDQELAAERDDRQAKGQTVHVKWMRNHSSNIQKNFRNYLTLLPDSFHQLDENLTFSNTKVKKTDYRSKRLPYPLEAGSFEAWDEVVGTLYLPEERAKIEWAIGAIISGDSRSIQKFLVLHGSAGAGKSTILNVVQSLTVGYYTTFEAKTLGSANNMFSTEVFKNNPLVAIQHDGDLSKIEDNTKLNSIVSHEEMTMNEKFKASYTAKINAFLLMGTNKPVQITEAKSGLLRRLIDVAPADVKIPNKRYNVLISQIDFELGAIAAHCLEVYLSMGKNAYDNYKPVEMMLQTNAFFNYIEDHFHVFKEQDGASLDQAWALYKTWTDDSRLGYSMSKTKFREELRNYFHKFDDRKTVNGERVRSWYEGFKTERFKSEVIEEPAYSLVMDETESLFDELMANQPAQYANKFETPQKEWSEISTTLADLDTTKLHYVKVPDGHVIIDFDLKGDDGQKSAEKNIEAASKFPATYAEYSKSGSGVHLHYDYVGDTDQLSRIYSEGIEVKVLTGGQALRRKFSKGNNLAVAKINSGLPLKEKKVINQTQLKSEKGLRDLIQRNLKKEIHPGTKSSVDFIKKILDEAHDGGMAYDVTDLRPRIMAFANNSTNQAIESLRIVQKMQFKSEEAVVEEAPVKAKDDRMVLFDVEVFKNLFVICWKYRGDSNVVRMINPTPAEVEELFELKLVGFNNRRYDNHMLWARYMGYNNAKMYEASKKIIEKRPGAFFGEAYNLSYADIFDFTTLRQGLKQFEIDLGIPHQELGLDWDEPAPEDMWEKVAEYCENDVRATEEVLEARWQDFVARQVLAALSGLPVNESTQRHTAKIVFGNERNPQKQFIYTDLAEMFPGYEFKLGKSHYKGELVGEGGYVYAEPGMYKNVALLDVESMHPSSIELLNAFGPFTKNFSDIKAARVAIKRGDFDSARKMLGGILRPYLENTDNAADLSYALKIAINIVYGLTSASFDNLFRDPRNKDNIVAKRGALFMIDLKEAVQAQGFTVAHIKTDSIKIPDATPEIIAFVFAFGEKYGYKFEHEATYEKFCLVNKAVYIAKVAATEKKPAYWQATGAQFQHPYVFKMLFSKEPLVFRDYCEKKSVQSGAMYLDFTDIQADTPLVFDKTTVHFIGKVGLFTPITPGAGGAKLVKSKDVTDEETQATTTRYDAVTDTKGYEWLESDVVEELGREDLVDTTFFNKKAEAAVADISALGDFEWLVE